ncbi:MAG: hypothetical protein ABSC94_26710 [Polyangiaceae bacterium]
MGENVNLVIAFERAKLEQAEADLSHLTADLAAHVLGAPVLAWIAVRNFEERGGKWPLSSKEIIEYVTAGQVIAAYPRDDGSSADGSIVWSLGGLIGTATIAIPADRVSKADRRQLAVASMVRAYRLGPILCAVGNELELNEDEQPVPDIIATRPNVELVALPTANGVVVFEGVGTAANSSHKSQR